MPQYPIFLSLENRKIVIFGAGSVGKRKLAKVLQYSPEEVVLIDPVLGSDNRKEILETTLNVLPEHQKKKLSFVQGAFRAEYIDGAFLVFAATNNKATNQQICEYCKTHSILCNRVDSDKESDFIVPAIASEGQISICISTEGASPALSKVMRKELETWLEDSGYAKLAVILGRLRPLITGMGLSSEKNAEYFRTITISDLKYSLRDNDIQKAKNILTNILPLNLHTAVDEVLYDI